MCLKRSPHYALFLLLILSNGCFRSAPPVTLEVPVSSATEPSEDLTEKDLNKMTPIGESLRLPILFVSAQLALAKKNHPETLRLVNQALRVTPPPTPAWKADLKELWITARLSLNGGGDLAAIHQEYRSLWGADASDLSIGQTILTDTHLNEKTRRTYAKAWFEKALAPEPFSTDVALLSEHLNALPLYDFFGSRLNPTGQLLLKGLNAYSRHDQTAAAPLLDKALKHLKPADNADAYLKALRIRSEIHRDFYERAQYLNSLKVILQLLKDLEVSKGLPLTTQQRADEIADVRYRIAWEEWFFSDLKQTEEQLVALLSETPRTSPTAQKLRFQAHDMLARRVYFERHDFSSMAKSFIDAILEAPDDTQHANEQFLAGFYQYLIKNYDQAIALFDQHQKLFEENKLSNASQYWKARSLQRQSSANESKAREIYSKIVETTPFDYYGHLAHARLPERLIPELPPSSPPTSISFPLPKSWEKAELTTGPWLIDQAVQLLGLGFPALAQIAIKDVLTLFPAHPDEPEYARYLGYLALSAGLRMEALWLFGEIANPAKRTGRNPDLLASYPRPFWEHFVATAKEFHLDPELLIAMAKQESGLTSKIISESLGYGLMQIQEKTGKLIAKDLHVQAYDPRQLLEPAVNIRFSGSYTRTLLNLFDGENLILAVGSYNAGDPTVNRWRSLRSNLDADEFVESIPTDGPRRHVKNVLQSRVNYRQLYGGNPLKLFTNH
jgi:soluble lytic murein transglycosylase